MAEADPLAEVLVDVACPACEARVRRRPRRRRASSGRSCDARAQRLLREVDALARAYGWTEAEVLALDERRRAAYLELAREGRA